MMRPRGKFRWISQPHEHGERRGERCEHDRQAVRLDQIGGKPDHQRLVLDHVHREREAQQPGHGLRERFPEARERAFRSAHDAHVIAPPRREHEGAGGRGECNENPHAAPAGFREQRRACDHDRGDPQRQVGRPQPESHAAALRRRGRHDEPRGGDDDGDEAHPFEEPGGDEKRRAVNECAEQPARGHEEGAADAEAQGADAVAEHSEENRTRGRERVKRRHQPPRLDEREAELVLQERQGRGHLAERATADHADEQGRQHRRPAGRKRVGHIIPRSPAIVETPEIARAVPRAGRLSGAFIGLRHPTRLPLSSSGQGFP